VLIVAEASEASPELVAAMASLVPQLSRSAVAPAAEAVQEIVSSPATRLFTARDGEAGPIVGMLTLVVVRIPTGVRASIEDVVVSEEARGQGCGEALSRVALEAAAAAGARTVDLTSRPSREGANRLYQRLGFRPRDTNVYRYQLSS
jgi:ribosomal protein S18 acetylase RimI-like enzyme